MEFLFKMQNLLLLKMLRIEPDFEHFQNRKNYRQRMFLDSWQFGPKSWEILQKLIEDFHLSKMNFITAAKLTIAGKSNYPLS